MFKVCEQCNDELSFKEGYIVYIKNGYLGYRCKKCGSFYDIYWPSFYIYGLIFIIINGLSFAYIENLYIKIIISTIGIWAAPIFIKYKIDKNLKE